MKKLVSKLISVMLAIAMLVTLGNVPALSNIAKAADAPKNVTLHFYNVYNWKQPAFQYWGGDSTVITGSNGNGIVESWNDKPTAYFMTAEENNWYSITFTGNLSGMQLLDFAAPSNSYTGNIFADAISYCTNDTATNVYMKWGEETEYKAQYYLDADYQTSIDTLKNTSQEESSNENNDANKEGGNSEEKDDSQNTTQTNSDGKQFVTLHVQIPNSWKWTTPALQYWGGEKTSVDTTCLGEVPGWGGAIGYSLVLEDNDGTNSFYKATLCGDFTGFQFFDFSNPQNGTNGRGYTKNIEKYTGSTSTDLYIRITDITSGGEFTWYETPAETTIKLHFKNTDSWEEVGLWMGQGDSWSKIPGYEQYQTTWPGALLNKDENGFYTIEVTKDMSTLHFIFNNNNKGGQTPNLEVTPRFAEEEYYIINDFVYPYLPTTDEEKTDATNFVVIEYNRPEGDYEGWNIYCWDSGLGTKTYKCEPVDINGKKYIIVPVKKSEVDCKISFCMRRSTAENEWDTKDGGDHVLTIPAGQNVVHAVFDQDKGITRIYPYNTGYEMDGLNNTIMFYYRDDQAIMSGTEGELGDVNVVVNGQSYDMTYDEENERYEYALTGIKTCEYAYYYTINGEKKLDSYNSATTTYNNEECSLIVYKTFENLSIEATVRNSTMTYNDNNVISVVLTGEDSRVITVDELSECKADLSELGTGELNLANDLLEGSFAVEESVEPGIKTITVTAKDTYGNEYKTTTTVEVIARTTTSSEFDWDEAVIYFAVTDRFFDGSEANNAGVEGENDVDKTGSLSYHGGDFAGLTSKLDYLKELGVNTIWITPIVAQSDITTKKEDSTIESTGYHGYWASDFTKLNGHLGTEEEFAALISEAHKRGMKLMVDVVLNHSGYDTDEATKDVTSKFTIVSGDETISMLRDDSNTIKDDDVYSSIEHLPDFVTENDVVRDQLIKWQTDWVAKYGIDYFRVDTVKHVDTRTWAEFKNELTKIDPNFKMIGEYYGGGYTTLDRYNGAMDSLLDFDFNDQAQAFVGGSIKNVEKFLCSRNSAINNTKTTGVFLSSHDEDGLIYKLINKDGMTEETAKNLFKVAASLQLTSKGQMVIYYGEELGLYGANNYPYQTNRYDYDWSLADEQSKNESSMLNHYKKLLAIRNQHLALFAKGTRTTYVADDNNGLDIFVRSYKGENAIVLLNIKENDGQKATYTTTDPEGTVYVDLYSGKEYTTDKDSVLNVDIPAAKDGGTVILMKKVTSESNNDETTGASDDTKKNTLNTVTTGTSGNQESNDDSSSEQPTITASLATSKAPTAATNTTASNKTRRIVATTETESEETAESLEETEDILDTELPANDMDVIVNDTETPLAREDADTASGTSLPFYPIAGAGAVLITLAGAAAYYIKRTKFR